ncbi:MAG: ribosomal protein L7/L12 [Candidatus Saccharimonas sp.]|nr:ribosomal protein L7/L12 [Planctomycetaceae bacterium]
MPPCPACGKSTSDTARFCESCGAPMTDEPRGHVELAHRVRRLLADGQKIEAIKVLREATGAGLAEAKQAVEAIERGEFLEAAGLDGDFEGELLRLLQAGRKIEAIKRYRERNPCGLKEAKDFVEALAAQRGIVAPRGGCLGMALALMTAFLIAAACVARADEATISSGEKAVEGWITHTVESEFQAKPTEIRVLLPDKLDPAQRHPVLYVLPVEAARESRYGDGLAEVKRCDLHNKHDLICVAPTFAHLPWYADHPADKSIRQESYFVKVIVPFIDEKYATRADKETRWLLGFSKSGWGAWSLLARHPDLFGRVAAWDAPLDMQRFDLYGAAQVFGTQEHFETYRVLPALTKSPTLALTTPRLILTGYDNFRTHHETAHRLLDEAKIPHVYRDGPKLKHVWDSGWVEEAVELLAELSAPSK